MSQTSMIMGGPASTVFAAARMANATAAKTTAEPVDPLVAAERAKKKEELEKVAKGFEAIFVRQMLSKMRSNSLSEGIDDGQGVEQFREMSDARMADDLSNKGALGIAQLLLQQLDKK